MAEDLDNKIIAVPKNNDVQNKLNILAEKFILMKRVLILMTTVDGGCTECVENLFHRFKQEFPQYEGLADKIIKQYKDGELYWWEPELRKKEDKK